MNADVLDEANQAAQVRKEIYVWCVECVPSKLIKEDDLERHRWQYHPVDKSESKTNGDRPTSR